MPILTRRQARALAEEMADQDAEQEDPSEIRLRRNSYLKKLSSRQLTNFLYTPHLLYSLEERGKKGDVNI